MKRNQMIDCFTLRTNGIIMKCVWRRETGSHRDRWPVIGPLGAERGHVTWTDSKCSGSETDRRKMHVSILIYSDLYILISSQFISSWNSETVCKLKFPNIQKRYSSCSNSVLSVRSETLFLYSPHLCCTF